MRIVAWRVTPVVMADDGEDLEPVNVQEIVIPAREWDAWKNGGDAAALRDLRSRIEEEKAGGRAGGAAAT